MIIFFITSKAMGQPHIEVYTVKARPFKGVEKKMVTLCDMDVLTDLTQALQARAGVFAQHPELFANYEAPLKQAFQCQYNATRYALQYLPAIVIDKRFVMYGGTVAEALRVYENSKNNGTANRLKQVAMQQKEGIHA